MLKKDFVRLRSEKNEPANESEISTYESTSRLEWAKDMFIPDKGNEVEDIHELIKSMAAKEIIEKKYCNVNFFEIWIKKDDLKFAKDRGFITDETVWNELDLVRVLEAFDKYLLENKTIIEDFEIIQDGRKRIATTIKSIQILKKQLQNNDRLIVGDMRHMFALRKNKQGKWILIDSVSAKQVNLENPFEWLVKKKADYHYKFICLN